MSRKRHSGFIEAGQLVDSQSVLMDSSGVSVRNEETLFELESDEELLCSVSEITEHLGRNITAALEEALSQIRKVVSARTMLLKMELREKTEEVEVLRARLEAVASEPSGLSRKTDFPLATQKNGAEQRKTKATVPAVKKENIDAICDYLMKDKNLRGTAEGENQLQQHQQPLPLQQHQQQASFSPWTDSEDIFNMLPSASKRLYDYEWMSGVELNSTTDFKVETESKCENIIAPSESAEEESEEGGGMGSGSSASAPLHLDSHGSPRKDRTSPVEDSMDRLDSDQDFSAPSFICPFCGTLCPDSSFLQEHLKVMHQDESVQGLEAGASSSAGLGNEGELLGKLGSDEPSPREKKVEGGYECGDCGRRFNYLGNLRQHLRIHTGEKPFVCPDCGERFRHAARLKSHRLTHSAESPYPCPECGKGFPVLSGLKRHQRVHTGESPYGCPQCGRRFKELGNLYTHMRIHSGATPYTCFQCSRSFRHLGTFKSHRCTPLSQVPSGLSPSWLQEDNVQTN